MSKTIEVLMFLCSHFTRLSGLDKFLDNSHVVLRRALLEHSLLKGIYAKGVLKRWPSTEIH